MAVDGKGNPNGLKHMMMIGNVMKDQIKKGLLKPQNVSIIGIMHGSALKWATKSSDKQTKDLINAIFKLKSDRFVTFHHLIPKTCHSNKWFKKRFAGSDMQVEDVDLCRRCHSFIHQKFPEKALGREPNTLEKLRKNETIHLYLKRAKKTPLVKPFQTPGDRLMSLTPWVPRIQSVLRVVSAYLFMLHGSAKLLHIPHIARFDHVHILSLAGVAGILELVGGALLVLGLLTRPVAFLLSGEMAFAYFMAHASKGHTLLPLINGGEAAVLYCFVFLFFAVAGGGSWSVDRMIGRK